MLVAAAIMHEGKVYSVPRPGRHLDVIREHLYGLTIDKGKQGGFLTHDGRFLYRDEALAHALSCGQEIRPSHLKGEPLISEDLW